MFKHEERMVPDRYYREFYSTYANYLGRYAFAARFLGSRATVIDLGCGCGYGSAHLAEALGRTVVGMDRSPEATSYARKQYRLDRLGFITADVTALPLAADSFDAAVALEMIEHVADAKAVLHEVRRVLKPCGVLVVSTPNRLVTGSGEIPANPFHMKEYTPEEFGTLLNGFFRNVTLYGQEFTPAWRSHREDMERIWHNISLIPLISEQLHALQARVEMDERVTGLSLLRKLKRKLLGRGLGSKEQGRDHTPDLSREFRHAQYPVSSMADWDISPYRIEVATVIIGVCRK